MHLLMPRANEILRKAPAYFVMAYFAMAGLDRRPR